MKFEYVASDGRYEFNFHSVLIGMVKVTKYRTIYVRDYYFLSIQDGKIIWRDDQYVWPEAKDYIDRVMKLMAFV